MKFLNTLVIVLAVFSVTAVNFAQAPDYAQFKTNDEANNIQVYKNASPSVVNITNTRLLRSTLSLNPQEVSQGNGTGFIWSEDGYIVTNAHVVLEADQVTVTLQDGTAYIAAAVGFDVNTDLMVLKIDAPEQNLIPVVTGDSSLLEVGRKVIAIGNPFGLDTTMTVGVVSALGREIDSLGRRKIRDVIQTDAAINPGNSGGPLLNSLGQLVGVNTQFFSTSGANVGIGFAIPVNTVKQIVPELIAYGRVRTPILGITSMPQPDYYRQLWGIEGVIILTVMPGSEPERLGMRGVTRTRQGTILVGDVIVGIDGQAVSKEDELASIIGGHEAGDEVVVTTRRENGFFNYTVELQPPRD